MTVPPELESLLATYGVPSAMVADDVSVDYFTLVNPSREVIQELARDVWLRVERMPISLTSQALVRVYWRHRDHPHVVEALDALRAARPSMLRSET